MSESDRAVLTALAAGRLPATIPADCEFGPELAALVALLGEVRDLALGLGRGDLRMPTTRSGGPIIGSLKALNASLRHLTWQAQCVARGDLSHRVDFMGEFSGAFNDMVRQLAERRQLEIQLLQAEKAKLLAHIARSIAHEINTPVQFTSDSIAFVTDAFAGVMRLVEVYREALAAVELQPGHAGLLQAVRAAEGAADLAFVTEEAGQAFSTAREGIDRVAGVIRAVEDFIGSDQPARAGADLNRSVLATATLARYRCQKVAVIETELGELPPVQCVVGEVNQALLALILNAADAIGDVVLNSGAIGRITVKTRAAAGMVHVEIADTGTGIPEDARPRIFEPSFTTRNRARWSGQGLPMARSVIVEEHGGTLTFDSEVGVGTTFRLTLPV